MAEFLIELYSEEIPPNLQIEARIQLKNKFREVLIEKGVNHKEILEYSSPTRLCVQITGLKDKIKIASKEVKGPKTDISNIILKGFLKSHEALEKDIYKKKTEKGEFYFLKTKEKNYNTKDFLIDNLPKILSSVSWKKSMKWSYNTLMWGRPLRSILAIYNEKKLQFKYFHLLSSDKIIIEKNLITKFKKIKNFKEYFYLLKKNRIFLNHNERKQIILERLKTILKSKNFIEKINERLLEEVSNIVEDPNILLVNFDKEYLKIPKEIIISTLEKHQRYFPIFDYRENLTNSFFVVANKKDEKKLIAEGNKRVVNARLADAKFFWEKDRSKNLIKQIASLKKIIFYEKIGSIYDKTQRLRSLAGFLSDELNINKEKVQIAASISKTDLCSDLVAEYPELQGIMGKYFALSQGFDVDVANSVSEHYLPSGLTSQIPKKPFSYSISIVDKIDSLVGFFLINERPTSSKDPFALRRAAIGLLRIIIENKLSIKVRDLINYSIRLYEEQGVIVDNENTEIQLIHFLTEFYLLN